MATYKRYHKNNILLGTGTYKYRPYTVLTPTVALTFNLTGCSTTATTANRLGTTSVSFTKSTGYNWPTSVQVTGATAVSWNQNTGILVIEKPTTDNVTIKVTCTKIIYSIAETLSGVLKSGTRPTSIEYGGTVTLRYTEDNGYDLPDSVTVTGGTYTWTKGTGTLVISNVTGDVSISIAGVKRDYYKLTFSGGTAEINGVDEPSPWQLSDGDVIKLTPTLPAEDTGDTNVVIVNGTVYNSSTTITVKSQDVVVEMMAETNKSTITVTIHYGI